MISCTEFIPLYSDFFKYLDSIGGHSEVEKYWEYVSDHRLGDKNNPLSLISFLERDGGFLGAVHYWDHTLSEEASDLYCVQDFVNHTSYSHMRRCPSKGRLNELKHVEPYYDYCGHCPAIFTRVLAKYGITYKMDHSRVDNAECFSILYETEKGDPGESARVVDENKKVIDMKAEDNKYLHPGFHISCDIALRYCGDTYGYDAVIDFLKKHTREYYSPEIEKIRKEGLPALRRWIESVYEREESSDVLHTEITDTSLTVTVDESPAIRFMKRVNHTPSRYHIEGTRTLYGTVAEECGLDFVMEYFDECGGTKYSFIKK